MKQATTTLTLTAAQQVHGMLGVVDLVDLEDDGLAAVQVQDQVQIEPTIDQRRPQVRCVLANDLAQRGSHVGAWRTGRLSACIDMRCHVRFARRQALTHLINRRASHRIPSESYTTQLELHALLWCHDPQTLSITVILESYIQDLENVMTPLSVGNLPAIKVLDFLWSRWIHCHCFRWISGLRLAHMATFPPSSC